MMAAWWLYYGDTVVVVGVVEWQLRQIVNEATRWWKRYYNGGGAAMVEGKLKTILYI